MKTILALAVILSSSLAFAGQDRGNGGDAVVCYTDATRSNITSVRMFDYWEQSQVINYGPVDLGSAQLSIQDKIEIATKRIGKFDPLLAEQIKKVALNLANNIQSYLVTSYELPEIDDAHPRAVPTEPNCYIEQYAVQYKDLVTGQRRFSIADKFYNHMSTSNNDRVGIILHEAVYRYAIKMNPLLATSDDVRYFNYVIGSVLLDNLKPQDIQQFHDVLVKTKIQQTACALKDGTFLKSNYGYEHFFSCYNQKMNLSSYVSVEITQGTKIDTYVMVRDEDQPNTAYPRKGITLTHSELNSPLLVEIKYNGQTKKFNAGEVAYREDDLEIDAIRLNEPTFNAQTIKGPGGTDFVCQTGIKFNTQTFDLVSCYIKNTLVVVGPQTYELGGYIRQLDRDRWTIDPFNYSTVTWVVKFNLLGSKKSWAITLNRDQGKDSNSGCKDDLITVDGNYNLVAGCFKSEQTLEVDGKVAKLLNFFEVQWLNGEYVLKAKAAHNSNAKGIYNPTYKNMRLVGSSKDQKFNYCGTLDFPSDQTWVWGEVAEDIGYPGESFYDISTDSVVYKSDENVSVINRVGCQESRILSNNY